MAADLSPLPVATLRAIPPLQCALEAGPRPFFCYPPTQTAPTPGAPWRITDVRRPFDGPPPETRYSGPRQTAQFSPSSSPSQFIPDGGGGRTVTPPRRISPAAVARYTTAVPRWPSDHKRPATVSCTNRATRAAYALHRLRVKSELEGIDDSAEPYAIIAVPEPILSKKKSALKEKGRVLHHNNNNNNRFSAQRRVQFASTVSHVTFDGDEPPYFCSKADRIRQLPQQKSSASSSSSSSPLQFYRPPATPVPRGIGTTAYSPSSQSEFAKRVVLPPPKLILQTQGQQPWAAAVRPGGDHSATTAATGFRIVTLRQHLDNKKQRR